MASVALLISIIILSLTTSAQDNDFTCPTNSGYGEQTGETEFTLDLQCQPILPITLEIEPDAKITVVVKLENYYKATGNEKAHFNIHLAMQRANIRITQPGQFNGQDITDASNAIHDVEVNASQDSFAFEITNQGFRSTIFDLSLRPVASTSFGN